MIDHLYIRSIDFAKASRNIALVPQRETFNMFEDLLQAVNVIRYFFVSNFFFFFVLPAIFCNSLKFHGGFNVQQFQILIVTIFYLNSSYFISQSYFSGT